MRLRVTVQRHGLPAVKLLWRVAPDCTTIATLLEQINNVIPLESETWDAEDYAVEVQGYECLHYQEVAKVLKDEDRIRIRALKTSDVRSRTVSGRYQVSSSGARLIDGIPYGRSYIKQPNRPSVHIPPRKRPRPLLGAAGDSSHDSQESPYSSHVQLRIGGNESFAAKDVANLASAMVPHKRQTSRSHNSSRRVSFDDNIAPDNALGIFDIYEDSDDEDDYTPSTSDSSSTSSHDSDSDAENVAPLKSLKVRDGISSGKKVKGSSSARASVSAASPSSSSSSSSSVSSSSMSSMSSVDDSDSSSSLSSSSSDMSSSSLSSDSSDEDARVQLRGSKTKKKSGLKATVDASKDESKAKATVKNAKLPKAAVSVSLTQATASDSERSPKTVQHTPPGQGTSRTKNRNERRRASKLFKKQEYEGETSKKSQHEKKGGAEEINQAVGPESLEVARESLLASIADGEIDTHAVLDADSNTKEASAQSKKAKQVSKQTPNGKRTISETAEEPIFSTPDDIQDIPEAKKPRTRLDLASSRRLLFGSLGLRAPRNENEEQKLRAHFMSFARPGTANGSKYSGPEKAQSSGSSNDTGLGIDASTNGASNNWKDKIKLTAIECVDENVELSAPPFPFVQRWDPQQQLQYEGARGKKRKRRNGYRESDLETDEQTNVILDYDDALGNGDEDAGAYLDACFEDDLPELPTNMLSLQPLELSDLAPGTVIAYQRFEVSEETNWQPGISSYKTAKVESADIESKVLQVQLAKRDYPSNRANYDENGNRIYGKYELRPDEDDEDADETRLELSWDELVHPKLIVSMNTSAVNAMGEYSIPTQENTAHHILANTAHQTTSADSGCVPEMMPKAVSNSVEAVTPANADSPDIDLAASAKPRFKKSKKGKVRNSSGHDDAAVGGTASASPEVSVNDTGRISPGVVATASKTGFGAELQLNGAFGAEAEGEAEVKETSTNEKRSDAKKKKNKKGSSSLDSTIVPATNWTRAVSTPLLPTGGSS